MKYIIKTPKEAVCVETGKKVAITNLNGFRKKNVIVEDKTKPKVKEELFVRNPIVQKPLIKEK